MNVLGRIYTLTSFGESHGPAIGGVIDGMPAGIQVDLKFLQAELNRRRPGQNALTTARNEADKVEILSGVFEGRTTGCPIGFIIRNNNAHSKDYESLRNVYRPSHADFTYQVKYGIRDYRGGGRASARETAVRVVGGAFAKMALRSYGIHITAFTSQVGKIKLEGTYREFDFSLIETNPVRCPDAETALVMAKVIAQVKAEGDTIGGVVTCVISGCPVGLGEPVFGKLQARLAEAMLSINAAKGFEYGSGFDGVSQRGSEQNDRFVSDGTAAGITTLTNHSGGIQGGLSNGQDIYFRVAFKPVATLLRAQQTVDKEGHVVQIQPGGRHDACVVPRAVPIVESMAAMVILDNLMLYNIRKC